ncbi:MAG: hypothetical protein ACP5QO_16315 [Clostridia bacterium]
MLGDTFDAWKRVIGQPGSWTLIVWMLGFGSVLGGLFLAFGIGAVWSALPHTPGALSSGISPQLAPSLLAHLATLLAVVVLTSLLLGPFMMAGLYGTIARAVAGERVGWGTFWWAARRLYGRAWGLVLYSIMYTVALAIASAILVSVLHAAGSLVMMAALILSIPFAIRMLGGLFLDERGFGESFTRSFGGPRYGGLLGGALLGVLVMMAGLGILAVLGLALGSVIMVVYYLVSLGLVVAAPAWFLALYRVAAAAA